MKKKRKIPFNKIFKINLFSKIHSIVDHEENGFRCSESMKQANVRMRRHFGSIRCTSRFANKYTLHNWL